MITSNIARKVVNGSTLPATCQPGQVFVVPSGGSTGMYVCFTANAWTLLDSSASGEVTGSGTTSALPKWTNGAGSVVGDSLLTDNATILSYNSGKFTVTAASGNVVSQGSITTGAAGVATGSLLFKGTTSGTVTVQPQDAAGTFNFNLPTSAGTAGQALLSGGGGGAPMTWGSAGITNSATNGQVAISDGTNIVGDADLIFSGDTLTATKFAGALNGTVGATTPAAGAFTTGSFTGTVTLGGRANTFTGPNTNNTAADVMWGQSAANTNLALVLSDKPGNSGNIFGIDRSDGQILHRWGRNTYDIADQNTSDTLIRANASTGQQLASGLVYAWSSSATGVTPLDTGLSRDSAGVIAVGTGAAGSKAGRLAYTTGILQPLTVATLPAGAAGMYAYVTDGDAGLAWGATVVNTGAGATKYLVWFNGTNWTVAGK